MSGSLGRRGRITNLCLAQLNQYLIERSVTFAENVNLATHQTRPGGRRSMISSLVR